MNLWNFPTEIYPLRQWVLVKNGSKIPYRLDGTTASVGDHTSWCTVMEARAAVMAGRFDGLGFVFDNNGIVGIDIDDGFDEDGFITAKAADIILNLHSYTEVSRSGRGFHILVRGQLPFPGRNNRDGVEAYQSGRYFIMTGDFLPGYAGIADNQKGIDYVISKYFPEALRGPSQGRGSRVYSPLWERPKGSRVPTRPNYPDIPQGCRNICLTSLGGMMHTIGYSAKQIRTELDYVNQVACVPKLEQGEVDQIVRSVVRYRR